jgi:glutaryl-CoA dehydrogenase
MTSGTDFYLLDERLTAEERAIRDRLRALCDRDVTPVINGYWERAEFPFALVPKIAELGLAGGVIEGYGCPAMSATAAGLVSMEWARADGSIGTFFGVHSNLAMQTIHLLGSEEQRERWLPRMAALEAIGAFGLTEPAHGSDAVALETSARRDGDEFVLDGTKKWIGNASFADVTIIWARGEDGHVGATSSRRARRASTPRSSPARRRCARSGRPRSRSTGCASPRGTGCQAAARFATSRGC